MAEGYLSKGGTNNSGEYCWGGEHMNEGHDHTVAAFGGAYKAQVTGPSNTMITFHI